LRQTLTLLLPLWLLTGCATKAALDHTPMDEAAFHRDLPTLKQEYSDIERYNRWLSTPYDRPTTESLMTLWGEPTNTSSRWGLYSLNLLFGVGLVATGYLSLPVAGVVVLLAPYPIEEYRWEKGDYEITAEERDNLLTGYESRIHRWEWKQRTAPASQELAATEQE
jgi:hypothetical protein